MHRLEIDIFPDIGGRTILTLTPREILSPLRKIEERGAEELARRDAANITRIVDYAVIRSNSG